MEIFKLKKQLKELEHRITNLEIKQGDLARETIKLRIIVDQLNCEHKEAKFIHYTLGKVERYVKRCKKCGKYLEIYGNELDFLKAKLEYSKKEVANINK